jgi:uncharacterized protein involved in outer membrane biogenesis
VEFANPEWASKPYLVKAAAAEFDIKLFPLLLGKVELPRIALTEPEIGLQMEPDGRRTWALVARHVRRRRHSAHRRLLIDGGSVDYQAAAQGANIHVDFSLAQEAAGQLPLSYKATANGKTRAFSANGRTGGVLQLSKDMEAPFPIEVNAVAGKTSLKAKGSIANLANLAGVDATSTCRAATWKSSTSCWAWCCPPHRPTSCAASWIKHGKVWAASQIQGTLGSSDLSGALSFDQSARCRC